MVFKYMHFMDAIKSRVIYGFINGRPRAARVCGAGGVVGGRRTRRGGQGRLRANRAPPGGGDRSVVFGRARTSTQLPAKVPLPLHHSVIVRGTVLISETSVIGTRWLCAVPPRARSLFRPRVLGDLQRGLHSIPSFSTSSRSSPHARSPLEVYNLYVFQAHAP